MPRIGAIEKKAPHGQVPNGVLFSVRFFYDPRVIFPVFMSRSSHM